MLSISWLIGFPIFFVGEMLGGGYCALVSEHFNPPIYGGLLHLLVVGGVAAWFISPVECRLWNDLSNGYFKVVERYRVGPILTWFLGGFLICWFKNG